jgi:LmbE family N-acetylglucosaminyl deacetylase
MQWVYLSPHLDDVALSCGGLVWEQVQSGDTVTIWTVCAGNPPEGELSPFAQELHARWQTGQDAIVRRVSEDLHSCRRLGARPYHFSLPDCIYRRSMLSGEFLYASDAALNDHLHPADAANILRLRAEIERSTQPGAVLVSPLGLGNHVDHQLTRLALEGSSLVAWYYADYPYVLREKEKLGQLEREGWISQVFPVSSNGLIAWQDSIAAHVSQISTFWKDEVGMRMAIKDYLEQVRGLRLWKKPIA